jgi:hypothetical protein
MNHVKKSKILHLDDLHKEVHIFGVELLAQVVHRLVHVLRQRVLLASADVVALTPDFLHMLPGGLCRRRHSEAQWASEGRRWEVEEWAAVPGFLGGF